MHIRLFHKEHAKKLHHPSLIEKYLSDILATEYSVERTHNDPELGAKKQATLRVEGNLFAPRHDDYFFFLKHLQTICNSKSKLNPSK